MTTATQESRGAALAKTRWEYRTFDLLKRQSEIEELNQLGQEGWEAVAMISSWGLGWRMVHPIVLFKRPLS